MENKKITILYLDDQIENLVAFKANFRKFYDIHTTSSPEEAIVILQSFDIHIIMIDQRMPEVTGTEFLKLINEEFPYSVKILVTGYIDLESSIDAINKAEIYRSISKPWNDHEIRIAIEGAYKFFCFTKEKREELNAFKIKISNSLKAPIANLEGLLGFIKSETNNEEVLKDYFQHIDNSIENIKAQLDSISILHGNSAEQKQITA